MWLSLLRQGHVYVNVNVHVIVYSQVPCRLFVQFQAPNDGYCMGYSHMLNAALSGLQKGPLPGEQEGRWDSGMHGQA